MSKLKGKVIAVTGASSGVGAALAARLATVGAVPVLMARRADKLAETAQSIVGEKMILTVDVTDNRQVEQAVEAIIALYGKIDGWVNNAGYGAFESVHTMKIAEFERLIEVNYMSIVRCTKAVLPFMLEAGGGHIVNVISVAGKIGTAKAAGYSASKHAALGFTTSLRAELLGSGVRVSAVNPGPIDTPFFDIADPSGQYKQKVQRYMLQPEQVAEAVCRVLVSGKADLTMPLSASLGAGLMQLFPNLLSGIAGKLLNKK